MSGSHHLEVDSLHPGMPVVLGQEEFGRLEAVDPQPDGVHVTRLITRRSSDGRLVRIPIDWVGEIRNGRLTLIVNEPELRELPVYVASLSATEARPRVQRALEDNPATRNAHIEVRENNGTLELHGTADSELRVTASAVARGVGAGPMRNLLHDKGEPASAAGYRYAWLHDWLLRAAGLDFEASQIDRLQALAEQKLADLFDVAEETAAVNGRSRILRQDLPLTKGLQLMLLAVGVLAQEFPIEPLLLFLSDAGVRAPIDDSLNIDVPRIVAALLLIIAQGIDIVEPSGVRPNSGHPSDVAIERVYGMLDLIL